MQIELWQRQQHLCVTHSSAHDFTLATSSPPLPASSSLVHGHTHTNTHSLLSYADTHEASLHINSVHTWFVRAFRKEKKKSYKLHVVVPRLWKNWPCLIDRVKQSARASGTQQEVLLREQEKRQAEWDTVSDDVSEQPVRTLLGFSYTRQSEAFYTEWCEKQQQQQMNKNKKRIVFDMLSAQHGCKERLLESPQPSSQLKPVWPKITS